MKSSPTPAAAKYSRTGHPSPPAPTTNTLAFFNLSWPAIIVDIRCGVSSSFYRALHHRNAEHSIPGNPTSFNIICLPYLSYSLALKGFRLGVAAAARSFSRGLDDDATSASSSCTLSFAFDSSSNTREYDFDEEEAVGGGVAVMTPKATMQSKEELPPTHTPKEINALELIRKLSKHPFKPVISQSNPSVPPACPRQLSRSSLSQLRTRTDDSTRSHNPGYSVLVSFHFYNLIIQYRECTWYPENWRCRGGSSWNNPWGRINPGSSGAGSEGSAKDSNEV